MGFQGIYLNNKFLVELVFLEYLLVLVIFAI